MMKLANSSGQSTVEFAVVIPVVIVIALISYHALSFLVVCSEFDRVARSAAVVQTAGGGSATDERILADLEAAFEDDRLTFTVTSEEHDEATDAIFSLARGSRVVTCRVEMRLEPWFGSFAGVATGIPRSVSHETSIVVDPYRRAVIV